MGIRIHKSIGYGFVDLVENDPRIDWGRFEEVREMDSDDFDTYLKLIDSRDDIDIMCYWRRENTNKKWDFYEVITRDTEFGLEGVLQFGHPSYPKWTRYNDDIDYYCSMTRGVSCEPYYNRISMGIYPYLSSNLIHIDTGQVVTEDDLRRMRYIKNNVTLSGGHYYEYHDGYENDFVHEQPAVVKHIAKFSGVKEEYLHQLVPFVYEYWA